jgi:S-formylglutathione hydrolase FrmB
MRLIAAAVLGLCALTAQTATRGTVERIKVHGKSLEGNLEGDSPDRFVSVYLPAAYKTQPAERFPVIYMLHGFTDRDDKWMGLVKHWINLPEVLDQAIGSGESRPFVLVMPDAFTKYAGSMYSSSATTGDWETFVSRELVAYIDSHYRTIPTVAARGVAGHSMGGYGALRIGMKNPDVFSSIYLLSACCMEPAQPNPGMKKAEQIRDPEEVAKADFFTKAMFASAAAWSPNPKNGPTFVDLPTKDGQPRADVLARWTANSPLAAIDQYIANLKRLKGIGMDAGTKDESIASATRSLDRILNDYGIAHQFEIYEGDHLNRIAERIRTKALPFFSKNLAGTR